jgi:YidC/Oxa1 family membrane protein insertase
VAIILLTVLIKVVFFPLSAASYKSMAKMKLITPRLTKLREMYAHDRNKMNQAMMELYKTEKINPLGGCFPDPGSDPGIHRALLGTACRNRIAACPVRAVDQGSLGARSLLCAADSDDGHDGPADQMNPVPPDPVQAQVMKFMPYVFSIFFFFFPAGLVLYWLVNNILSILQQWQIQRMFDRDKPAHGKR